MGSLSHQPEEPSSDLLPELCGLQTWAEQLGCQVEGQRVGRPHRRTHTFAHSPCATTALSRNQTFVFHQKWRHIALLQDVGRGPESLRACLEHLPPSSNPYPHPLSPLTEAPGALQPFWDVRVSGFAS